MPPKDFLVDPSTIDFSSIVDDIEGIRKYNPQRFEMEQLTAIVKDDPVTNICVGYKDVREDEFWTRGHMPGMPLMPGVLMLEAAAQLSSYYTVKHNLLESDMIGFGGLDEVRFRDPVRPGDRLVLAASMIKARPRRLCICRFQGLVGTRIAVEGRLMGIPLPTEALKQMAAKGSGK